MKKATPEKKQKFYAPPLESMLHNREGYEKWLRGVVTTAMQMREETWLDMCLDRMKFVLAEKLEKAFEGRADSDRLTVRDVHKLCLRLLEW